MKKTQHHYVFTEISFKPSRTYGGGTYTIAIHKLEALGKTRRIGEVTACTRGHKGQDHEAWTLIQKDLPPALLKKIHKAVIQGSNRSMNYIPYNLSSFGVVVQELR